MAVAVPPSTSSLVDFHHTGHTQAKLVRITTLTSKDHMGPQLYRTLHDAIEGTPPLAILTWVGRHAEDTDGTKMTVVIVTAWLDGEHLRQRWTQGYIDEPFAYDKYKDLVESFRIEHFERPGD